MHEYEITFKIKLDDQGYLLKNNWIYDAIQEQLNYNNDKEEILECSIKQITLEV
jgi:hypothetical protein